jgi:Zn-dependent peptidase ImmA (M78 family)
MPGPVTDPRAHALRERYQQLFDAPELPVPVQAITEDLLGLHVEQSDELDCSGLLLPTDRRIVLNAAEPPTRQRFTLAHELGHWVCQVLEGHTAPVFCRDTDLAPDANRALEREANVFAAELLMPEEAVRAAAGDETIAARFAVSREAIAWRLFSFGLGEKPERQT